MTPEYVEFLSTLKASLKAKEPELRKLFEANNDHWGYEDGIYRFYHGSFKVYRLQDRTVEMVEMLKSLVPEGTTFHPFFQEILDAGTGHAFQMSHNHEWTKRARPIVEAFFHARYALEMAVRYIDAPSESALPSGWAALLSIYQHR